MMSRLTRIAITGGEGRLATALRAYFPHADYLSRRSCDVADWRSVRGWFGQHRYDLILHCAAETRHDAAPARYWHVNIMGTVAVTQAAEQQGARLVYCSTDYVYPGTGAHTEADPVAPRNTYAWSKLGGECVVAGYPNAVTVRGSWYSDLKLQRAATDAFTSKIPVAQAAAQIATVAVSHLTGVVNVGGAKRSLYEIALAFNPRVEPISRVAVQCGYEFPADMSLNLTRLRSLG